MNNRLLAYRNLIFPELKKFDELCERLNDLGFKYVSKRKLFYIHDYYSKSRFEDIHKSDPYTRNLLKLKNKDSEQILEYSKKIAEFISATLEDGCDYTIMCVPSADKDNISCMEYCIEIIKNNPDMISNKAIHLLEYNYSLFRRFSINKVHKSKKSERPDFINQILSIGCKFEEVKIIKNSTVVLIDDISTTGSSLFACASILALRGVNPKNIIKLAMGYTVLSK